MVFLDCCLGGFGFAGLFGLRLVLGAVGIILVWYFGFWFGVVFGVYLFGVVGFLVWFG